jgi:hypothetical protein
MKIPFVLLFCGFAVVRALDICPQPEEIRPCTCMLGEVSCHGDKITQQSLENLFNVIRSYESNPFVKLFSLRDTLLQEVDLAIFTNVTFDRIMFGPNYNLSKITPPPSGIQIISRNIHLQSSPLLTDVGGLSLNLAPSTLHYFMISRTSILPGTGSEGQDILPGLSSQDQLDQLELSYSVPKITWIGGGQFKHFPKIRHITLYQSGVEEIGAGAFDFNEYPSNFTSALFIMLNQNNVTDAQIHPDHGLDKITNRRVFLYIENNNLETLSQEKFEPYLRSGVNSLIVGGNPLVCDVNVKWLKDGRQQYERQVGSGAKCINDPGYTVFTSPLIP